MAIFVVCVCVCVCVCGLVGNYAHSPEPCPVATVESPVYPLIEIIRAENESRLKGRTEVRTPEEIEALREACVVRITLSIVL